MKLQGKVAALILAQELGKIVAYELAFVGERNLLAAVGELLVVGGEEWHKRIEKRGASGR